MLIRSNPALEVPTRPRGWENPRFPTRKWFSKGPEGGGGKTGRVSHSLGDQSCQCPRDGGSGFPFPPGVSTLSLSRVTEDSRPGRRYWTAPRAWCREARPRSSVHWCLRVCVFALVARLPGACLQQIFREWHIYWIFLAPQVAQEKFCHLLTCRLTVVGKTIYLLTIFSIWREAHGVCLLVGCSQHFAFTLVNQNMPE